ncbi:hypothetical protein OIE66_32720 [Nonomuraea sp. NBC_01738]|uniref:hypothetical protein n=1 Tax=Nonomuraea sp. NBC_01738 TaxID=2976003 RepID=UPI002E0E1F22|nr:hypothetical protein OIE66_32720 [Nonomuraea sp. NBC_01738]
MIAALLADMPEARVFLAGVDGVAEGVDLDHDVLESPSGKERAAEVLVIAGTPADLRRAATLHKLLPDARRVVVAVLDTPPSHPAPVPTPTPAHRWRTLTDLRVHQPKERIWVVDARFSAATPAGRTVAATARAFAGHRLDVIAAPAAAIAGVGAADWRPGDPNATPADVGGPVPERVGAPGSDVVLRTLDSPDITGEPQDAFTGLAQLSGLADDLAEAEPWEGDERPVERPTARAASWEQLGRPGGAELPLADPEVLSEPSMIPPVDERLVNPQGFVTTPSKGMAGLTERDSRWSVVLDGRVVTRFAESGGVTDADVARLRQIRGVEVDWQHAHGGTGRRRGSAGRRLGSALVGGAR